MNHDPPDLKLIRIVNFEHWVFVVGWTEFNISVFAMGQVEEFHREATVPPSHDDGAMMGFDGAVDDHPVTIEEISIFHRITFYIPIESGFWMTDIVAVEVQRFMTIIVCR